MTENKKQKVLFLCTHNSARSQMAEGLMNAVLGDKYEASSAGTEPTSVNEYAIRAMDEIGIDISLHTTKGVDAFIAQRFGYVVTVCDNANEACPYFPNAEKRIHQGFLDPTDANGDEEERLAVFRKVRDEIKDWILKTFNPSVSNTNKP